MNRKRAATEHPSDRELLENYSHGTQLTRQRAFNTLVQSHLDHVHSVALRVTRNTALAADVAQRVFVKLATNPTSVPPKMPLAAWLHVKARSLAIDMIRSEEARRQRERLYQETLAITESEPEEKKQQELLESLVDQGIETLPAKYRNAVILRFYKQQTYAAVGAELSISEDAARMRIRRALDRLRDWLQRRSVPTNDMALSSLLGASAVASAPKTLAASICIAAAPAASSTAILSSTLTTAIAMNKIHLALVGVLCVSIPIIALQHSQNTKLREQVEAQQKRTPIFDATQVSSDKIQVRRLNRVLNKESRLTPTLRDIFAKSDPLSRLASLLAYAESLRPDEIQPALEELRGSSPEWDVEAKVLTHMLLTRWAQEDPEAAFASLNSLDFKKLGGEPSSLLSSLAALDPARAAAWLEAPDNKLISYPGMGRILAGTIAKEWVRQDVDAAVAWTRTLPEDRRAGALSGVLGILSGSDPRQASQLATELDRGPERSHAVGEVAATWARQSPAEAMAWAQSLDGTEGEKAIGRALDSWTNFSPREAVQWLDEEATPEIFNANLPLVAGSWAAREPAAAAQWVASHREGEGKGDALGLVMWNWTHQDPEAAANWLDNQPPGESRDRGIIGLARAAFDTDPASAVTWAATIQDESLRQGALDIGLRAWNERDPENARAWSDANGLALPSPEPSKK